MRKFFTLAVLFAGAVRTPLLAQTSFRVGIGPAVPLAELGENDVVGYQVMAAAQTFRPEAVLGFRVDGSFQSMAHDGTIQPMTDRFITFTAGAAIRKVAPSAVAPYAIATFGMYRGWQSPTFGIRASNDFGTSVGAGATVRVRHVQLFGELRYHRISEDGAQFLPISFGVVF